MDDMAQMVSQERREKKVTVLKVNLELKVPEETKESKVIEGRKALKEHQVLQILIRGKICSFNNLK